MTVRPYVRLDSLHDSPQAAHLRPPAQVSRTASVGMSESRPAGPGKGIPVAALASLRDRRKHALSPNPPMEWGFKVC